MPQLTARATRNESDDEKFDTATGLTRNLIDDAKSQIQPVEGAGPEVVVGAEVDSDAREDVELQTLYCRQCASHHSVTDMSVESTHRSAEGLVSYIRCPAGNLVIHQFAESYSTPPPPPSVLALRARLAAAAEILASEGQ